MINKANNSIVYEKNMKKEILYTLWSEGMLVIIIAIIFFFIITKMITRRLIVKKFCVHFFEHAF